MMRYNYPEVIDLVDSDDEYFTPNSVKSFDREPEREVGLGLGFLPQNLFRDYNPVFSVSTEATMKTIHLSDLLCRLPEGLLGMILREYLTIRDWSRMDRALCTHHHLRGAFLAALRSDTMKLSVTASDNFWTDAISRGIVNWIIARGIRIDSWNRGGNSRVITTVVTNCKPDIRILNTSCAPIGDGVALTIASRLHKLISLNISHVTAILFPL